MPLSDNDKIYDITILGGGPTGLFAAFYAGLRNSSCKIIDSLPVLGGRLTSVYPEKFIYDVAGFPKILAKDLVTNLVEQIEPYKTQLCLSETAQTLTQAKEGYWIIETEKQRHFTKTVIIASGVGCYTPKKHHAVGASTFEGKGITYAVLQKNGFARKKVVVVGGGDSALDWAIEFLNIGCEVYLVHRSNVFRAHDDTVQKIFNSRAKIFLNTEITEFSGNEKLESITLKNLDNEQISHLEIDEVCVMFGYNSSLGRITEWNLELSGNGILVNQRMETNLPGVFAAGDIAKHDGKLDLIATGFSEAATAVAFAKVFMNPKEKAQPMHSTTIMEIKAKIKKREQENNQIEPK